MADIRINALATTAASTASDDFVAVDGSANGTRKLNAFSPTFGGNLTVSGTGESAFSGTIVPAANITKNFGKTTAAWLAVYAKYLQQNDASGYLTSNTDGSIALNSQSNQNITLTPHGTGIVSVASNLTVSGTGTSTFSGPIKAQVGSGASQTTLVNTVAIGGGVGGYGACIGFTSEGETSGTVHTGIGNIRTGGYDRSDLAFYAKAAQTTGNFSSSDEVARFVASSGNLLIGTTTDGGQKLQVSGSAIFGSTNTAQLSNPTAQIIRQQFSASTVGLRLEADSANAQAVIGTSSNHPLLLRTNDTTALTLDSSQNATFAGKITANGAGSTFKGTATNDNAAAGYVGEFVSSAVVSASAVSLTNGAAANITSISLTAGDWDVTGLVQYNFTGATCSFVYHGFSSASASFGAPNSYVQDYRNYTTASVSTHNPSLTFRFSLAATTTVYFVTQADFSAGTVAAYGRIQARRVR